MNIGAMMKQMQGMQAKMTDMQNRLGDVEVTGSAGGGMIEILLTGKGEAKKVKIDPKLLNPSDVEMLEDLMVAAINDGRLKVERAVAGETEKIMGGLQLPPGIKLPF